jgi:uncharacterized protein YjbI with pentapeptide repeats
MDIEHILAEHKKWLNCEGGRQANLQEANLRRVDLWEANLWEANLREANLRGADLRGADLRGADLRGADLRGADLREADLREADLRGSDLDFSAWPFHCGSFNVKTDDRLVAQLFAHIARLDVSGCSPVVRYAHWLIFSTWPGKWLKNLFCEHRDDVSRV